MIRQLVHHADPVLHLPAAPFDFSSPVVDPKQLANDLDETMKAAGGIGLAAPQVGLPTCVLAIADFPRAIVMFNPRIETLSSEKERMEEGCLSYPGARVTLERASRVSVMYEDESGTTQVKHLERMQARVFLHEYDHLIGKTMMDHLSSIKRERAMKQVKSTLRLRRALKQ